MPLAQQMLLHPTRTIKRCFQILLVNFAHHGLIFWRRIMALIIKGRAVIFQQFALPDHADFGMFRLNHVFFRFCATRLSPRSKKSTSTVNLPILA